MATRKGRQTAVGTVTSGGSRSTSTTEEDPLFGVAMLKIALELKRPGAGTLEAIVSRVMARMQLDEGEFREFLQRQGGLLRTIAKPHPT